MLNLFQHPGSNRLAGGELDPEMTGLRQPTPDVKPGDRLYPAPKDRKRVW